jgi:hypothetical protein
LPFEHKASTVRRQPRVEHGIVPSGEVQSWLSDSAVEAAGLSELDARDVAGEAKAGARVTAWSRRDSHEDARPRCSPAMPLCVRPTRGGEWCVPRIASRGSRTGDWVPSCSSPDQRVACGGFRSPGRLHRRYVEYRRVCWRWCPLCAAVTVHGDLQSWAMARCHGRTRGVARRLLDLPLRTGENRKEES